MVVEREETPYWNRDLADPALSIAGNEASPLRVSAGPGTGKTFALMRRVARLLEEGADPNRVLVITFTRTAARDITREISRLEVDGAAKVVSGTLHSFCFKLLAKASVFEFTNRNARALHDFERAFLFEDLKVTGERDVRACKSMVRAFEADWARLQHEQPGWPTNPRDQSFHHALMDWLRFHECMLLGELPTLALTFLQQNPAAPECDAFDHVLVDEYQDLNRADQELIDLLARSGTLTVVGDEDQSIYGRIRHAQPEGMRNFADTHPNTQSETMDVCRRCPPQVVDMANQLIGVNREREYRALVPLDPGRPGYERIVQWPTMEQEATGVAEFVKLYLEKVPGTPPGQVLVLSPRRDHGRRLTQALLAEGVPAISYYFEKVFSSDVAQEKFTLLTHVVDPEDRVAIRSWLGFNYGEGARTPYAYIRRYCEQRGVSPIEALEAIQAGTLNFTSSRRLLERWRLLEQQRATVDALVGRQLIDKLFPENEDGIQELRLIASALQDRSDDDITPQRLYEAILDRIINPEPPEADAQVRVMSAYKAKGLTVKLVVMTGSVETWYPMVDDGLAPEELRRQEEEQRRLFYVGITRPTDALVISSFGSMPTRTVYQTRARARLHQRGRGYGQASRFIAEMGATAPGTILGANLLAEMVEL